MPFYIYDPGFTKGHPALCFLCIVTFAGEKKLATVAPPDKWKDGARNSLGFSLSPTLSFQLLHISLHLYISLMKFLLFRNITQLPLYLEGGGRKIGENKALAKQGRQA